MKKVFLSIIILPILLQSCSGQTNKGDLRNKASQKEIEKNNTLTQSDFNVFPGTNVNDQISQVVRTIFQDSKGNFWFGTQNGAFRLTDKSLTHIDKIIGESGKGVTIKKITESKDGKIWLGHSDGISSIDGNTVTNYYESDGLISNDVWSIAADKNGRIWIGTIAGVCVFNGQGFTEFVLPEGQVDSTLGVSSTKMVHSIFEDSKGTLWFSSNAGLFSYANNSLINVSKKAGIQTNFVNEIFEDKNGELWVSTKNGLYHLINNKGENITKGKIETGKGIGSIAEDKDGNIWFVSNQHHLYSYDGNELIKFQKSEYNKGPGVFQIFKDQDNRLWFVGFGGAFRLENGIFINVTKNGPW
ncbi:hypothetical protein JKA74_09390 [Marivirga sp. S37H4]|uniref:Two component regulator propeller n=1 Tax=Marivirga aurantiaca TaxID=2802615 RepID=A0A934WYK7_9BACT|nr:two-component regulator propeller domain-containing protein [Marivirga aurantiaca]MBK6265252.1 hypothetical protein [Marivirga aurantiaca]